MCLFYVHDHFYTNNRVTDMKFVFIGSLQCQGFLTGSKSGSVFLMVDFLLLGNTIALIKKYIIKSRSRFRHTRDVISE